ncbi:MAG TPA: ADOP family duplicated permease [Vicinamibacterales bacterium]|nr:ADOP family duplicated permease [Vicinamibacterales bacterium]
MRPDDRELDDEIRGHLALEIQQRIDRGESPQQARANALKQFGYVPQMRDEMRRVWYGRWYDMAEALVQDMRVGLRSLMRAKGLSATVVITLALGIGANAAIFSVVRGVLMRPLVNRGEERLLYIRQSAPGLGVASVSFSVPEIKDIRDRATTIEAFGEFSTVEFTLVGLGEPRVVQSGVVDGHYFDVVGLRATIGRLIEPKDEGLNAAGVAVLTNRFWTASLNSDPSVIGKTIQLGTRSATVIGVLEPSVPYPADTEIIANMVTSPHHMGAQMVTMRTHRMTQLFGRLKAGNTIEDARSELSTIHSSLTNQYPESYPQRADMHLEVAALRDQIAAPARPVLLVLLAAAAVVFIIACSNVANLILARSVRREGELAVRAALGASRGALRRTLLAESLVLCGAGAVLGVLLARPMVAVVASFAARFSVRALEVTVDSSMLWVGATLAMAASVLLAYVPRLPSAQSGNGLAAGSIRITPGINRRLKIFATTQVAFSFVLLAGAATLLATLIALRSVNTGYDMQQVLAIDLPMQALGIGRPEDLAFYQQVTQKIAELPGVEGVSMGSFTPWRDAGKFGGAAGITFGADGFTPADGEDNPRARLRIVAPDFFHVLGVPMIGGRDFTPEDRRGSESVVIVSQSLAQRLYPNGEAINHKLWWIDPYFGPKPVPRRIVGIVGDVDDERIATGSVMTVYHPLQQMGVAGRLFVRAGGDPHSLIRPITQIVHGLAINQPVERAATLEDVRAEVLAPERLNAFVFAGFAGVALLIAVVGVAGVLAFGVSSRTREFGVRLAIGSTPHLLLMKVLKEGAVIVSVGIIAGTAFGYLFAGIASTYFQQLRMPGLAPLLGAAAVLIGAAIAASLMPAARASRVDVLQALRSE